MDEWNQKIALDMGDRNDEVKVKAKEYYKRPGQCGSDISASQL